MLPNTDFYSPKRQDQLPKADLRREITPWRALVWAYRDECVGIANNAPQGHHLYCDNGLAQSSYGERMARGSINARLDAHEDAFAIDSFLWDAVGRDEKPYHAIRAAAEWAKPIAPEIVVPAITCVPLLDGKGRPTLVLPLRETHRERALWCVITYEGYPADKAAALRRAHAALFDLFVKAMACMVDMPLSKWRVIDPLTLA